MPSTNAACGALLASTDAIDAISLPLSLAVAQDDATAAATAISDLRLVIATVQPVIPTDADPAFAAYDEWLSEVDALASAGDDLPVAASIAEIASWEGRIRGACY